MAPLWVDEGKIAQFAVIGARSGDGGIECARHGRFGPAGIGRAMQAGIGANGGRLGGGVVDSCGDHRIAMALAVAGSVATGSVTVRNADAVATSFPGFAGLLASIGLRIKEAST